MIELYTIMKFRNIDPGGWMCEIRQQRLRRVHEDMETVFEYIFEKNIICKRKACHVESEDMITSLSQNFWQKYCKFNGFANEKAFCAFFYPSSKFQTIMLLRNEDFTNDHKLLITRHNRKLTAELL